MSEPVRILETLWAPWRLAYIQATDKDRTCGEPTDPATWRAGADHGCFLCRAAAADPPHARGLGVVDRTPRSIVVINRYPYSNGHLLVAPLDHHPGLGDLGDAQLLDLQQLIRRWCGLVTRSLEAEGFNIGLNLGRVAGAGLPGHLHWHIVPRWTGDVNFMPTVASARVLPQALDSLWEQLTEAAR